MTRGTRRSVAFGFWGCHYRKLLTENERHGKQTQINNNCNLIVQIHVKGHEPWKCKTKYRAIWLCKFSKIHEPWKANGDRAPQSLVLKYQFTQRKSNLIFLNTHIHVYNTCAKFIQHYTFTRGVQKKRQTCISKWADFFLLDHNFFCATYKSQYL